MRESSELSGATQSFLDPLGEFLRENIMRRELQVPFDLFGASPGRELPIDKGRLAEPRLELRRVFLREHSF